MAVKEDLASEVIEKYNQNRQRELLLKEWKMLRLKDSSISNKQYELKMQQLVNSSTTRNNKNETLCDVFSSEINTSTTKAGYTPSILPNINLKNNQCSDSSPFYFTEIAQNDYEQDKFMTPQKETQKIIKLQKSLSREPKQNQPPQWKTKLQKVPTICKITQGKQQRVLDYSKAKDDQNSPVTIKLQEHQSRRTRSIQQTQQQSEGKPSYNVSTNRRLYSKIQLQFAQKQEQEQQEIKNSLEVIKEKHQSIKLSEIKRHMQIVTDAANQLKENKTKSREDEQQRHSNKKHRYQEMETKFSLKVRESIQSEQRALEQSQVEIKKLHDRKMNYGNQILDLYPPIVSQAKKDELKRAVSQIYTNPFQKRDKWLQQIINDRDESIITDSGHNYNFQTPGTSVLGEIKEMTRHHSRYKYRLPDHLIKNYKLRKIVKPDPISPYAVYHKIDPVDYLVEQRKIREKQQMTSSLNFVQSTQKLSHLVGDPSQSVILTSELTNMMKDQFHHMNHQIEKASQRQRMGIGSQSSYRGQRATLNPVYDGEQDKIILQSLKAKINLLNYMNNI